MKIKVDVCENCPFMSYEGGYYCNLAVFLERKEYMLLHPELTIPDWCDLNKESLLLYVKEEENIFTEDLQKQIDEFKEKVTSLQDASSKLQELYSKLGEI